MSFYEDRKKEKEEDVELRKRKQRMCFVSEYKVFKPPPVYSCFLLYYLT
jgi:hypothetical protein